MSPAGAAASRRAKDDLRSQVRSDRVPIDWWRLGAVAAVGLPVAVYASTALRPWAATVDTVEFATAEGLGAAPIILLALLLIAVAYRPLLRSVVVDARGSRATRMTNTPAGTVALLSPILGAVFVPMLAGGRWSATVLAAAGLAVLEVVALETTRRSAPNRSIRWTDPSLEAYRRRGAALAAVVAIVGCAMAVAGLATTHPSVQAVLGIAAYGIPLSVAAPYLSTLDLLPRDSFASGADRLRVLCASALITAPLLVQFVIHDPWVTLATGAIVATPLGLCLEISRRRCFAAHVDRLRRLGFDRQLTESYGHS